MNDIIKQDILRVLAEAITALQQGKDDELAMLSNKVIHDATIFQDEDSLAVATLMYAVGKVMERAEETNKPKPDFIPRLKELDALLSQDNIPAFREQLRHIFDAISSQDDRLHLFVESVIRKAQLKKAAKIHEHGISIARASEMLGVSQWELLSYLGKTTIPEVESGDHATKRLKKARELFS